MSKAEIDTDVVTKLTKHLLVAIDKTSEEMGRVVKMSEVIHAFAYYMFWAGDMNATERQLQKAASAHGMTPGTGMAM